jgi:translocation-and-assembly-module (TAM) inner membrane subunit TamB-like protein
VVWRRRIRRVSTTLVKTIVWIVFVAVVLVGLILVAIQTGWVKNTIRTLIVTQANQYLTATLSIGRLEGSLVRGLRLTDVTVSRDGKPLIHVDEIEFAYSIRELLEAGTVIRSVRLARPIIVAGKQPDGRWDLGTLVKRESREGERTGPSRPIEVQAIEIVDGRISLNDPVAFGPAHIPTQYESLNASFRFAYFPVRWALTFDRVSWIGRAPDLSVQKLAGRFGHGPTGWFFENFTVDTARSSYTLAGTINTAEHPTVLDLRVVASRFAFQEWSGVLRGLKNIAVESSFDTSLKGPVTALQTTVRLEGTGGSVDGHLTLDTSVPGWHGAGTVTIDRLNLARWLNRDDRPSDITGTVTFDLALQLGQHFPRGVYDFTGRHAMYMNYAADAVRARGQITSTDVLIADASGTAYGAHVTVDDGSIGIDSPFPYRFKGTTTGVDLRRVPRQVPVPHVESVLAMDYDVSGRFSDPFIIGRAAFARSEFLGATIGSGTIGSIDTSQRPIQYAGEGDVENLSIRRFGEGLDVAWMRDPRYDAEVAGRFHVEGSGSDAASMRLRGGGRLTRATAFKGALSNADVSVDIADGTLRASYDGALAHVDPSIPFADPRYEASLTGSGRITALAHDLLTRTTTLADYEVDGALSLTASEVRGFHVDRGELAATLNNSALTVTRADMTGPEITGTGHGTLGLTDNSESDFTYDLSRVDLTRVRSLTDLDLSGTLATKGRATGPADALHAIGEASVTAFDGFDVHALSLGGTYDIVIRPGGFAHATLRTEARAAFVSVGGQSIDEASGTVTFDAQRLGFDLTVKQREGRTGTFAGNAILEPDAHAATILDLTMNFGSTPWRLVTRQAAPVVTWPAGGISITPVEFVNGDTDQRIGISGNWRSDGAGAVHVTAHSVALETLEGVFQGPTRYGGVLDGDATIRGTREHPIVDSTLTISNGRVERVTYQSLTGTVNYADRNLHVDLRLDQSPGIWVTAVGVVPISFFTTEATEQPVDVAIKSSGIDLGLLDGLTNVVRSIHGTLVVDVRAVGTSHDPHFDGSVKITGAAFVVDATGVSYKNGSASLALAPDRITVDTLHVEDSDGRPLDVRGSLGTHELRLGDLEIEATARRFQILRNEFGRVDVDAALRLRGRSEAPRVTGDVTISGGDLRVDEILQQTVFRPYGTEPTAITEVDAVAALNPWNKLALDVALHVPNTLRLVGENVQVSPGAPIGIGDINLRVLGDLYLYKDPGVPLFVNGSLDRVVGTFTFQGRRFDVDPASSINFRGDLNPEVYVTVRRVISGVETRVSILGPLQQPELRLASSPPLDESDILSLIVFNTSSNQLTAGQQQELLVRAATLAAGFVATPIVSAIENELGIDVLEIEPSGDFGRGPRVTIGDEIAPGLVARFSRQFGQEPYDEATIEYYLSRLFRLRATFSDAQSLSARSPFRRVERAGIDLLLFFSF